MFRFFSDIAKAEIVAQRLENLGVPYVMTKHTITDCVYGRTDYAYIEVAENYSHTLNFLAEDVKGGHHDVPGMATVHG